MRIALVGVAHETNTFSRVPATYEEFEKSEIARGDEIVRQYRDSYHTNAGFLEAGDRFGFGVVPLLYAQTGPIGTITRDAFERILGLQETGVGVVGVSVVPANLPKSESSPVAGISLLTTSYVAGTRENVLVSWATPTSAIRMFTPPGL